jgi:hypothetical protein
VALLDIAAKVCFTQRFSGERKGSREENSRKKNFRSLRISVKYVMKDCKSTFCFIYIIYITYKILEHYIYMYNYIYHIFFIHITVHGHSLFHIMPIVNNAAVNMEIQISLYKSIFIFFEHMYVHIQYVSKTHYHTYT